MLSGFVVVGGGAGGCSLCGFNFRFRGCSSIEAVCVAGAGGGWEATVVVSACPGFSSAGALVGATVVVVVVFPGEGADVVSGTVDAAASTGAGDCCLDC